MAKNVVAIKIKIVRNSDKSMNYPPFKTLANYERSSIYYDRTSNCDVDSVHSPMGENWALKFVPEAMANEAAATWPTRIIKLTDAEAKTFYENYVSIKQPEENVDINILQALKMKYDIMEALGQDTTAIKTKMAKAIDANDVEPGISKNEEKTYADFKTKYDLIVKASL